MGMRRRNLLYLVGMLVVGLGITVVPSVGWAAYGDHVSDVGATELTQPVKVAVDTANGDLYVTDAGTKTVKKYNKSGTYQSSFSVSGTPVGIAVTASNIFVGDSTNQCVWIYDKSGNLATLAATGPSHVLGGNGLIIKATVKMPNAIAVSPAGHIFVADGDNDFVRIYNSDGSLYTFVSTGATTFGQSGNGTSSGSTIYLYYPSGIVMGNADAPSGGTVTQHFFVVDQGNYRVQRCAYTYNTTTKYITAWPTYDGLTVGSTTRADAFGSFLRPTDVSWDTNLSRLAVSDALQNVAQQFDSSGNTRNPNAFNYSGGVLSYLNVPTGTAMDNSNAKLYVANNQASNVAVFSLVDGTVPTISITAPSTAVDSCSPAISTYNVQFSGTDNNYTSDGSATVKVYYYNTSTPSNKILFSTQTVTVSGTSHTYSGSATFDLVGTYPSLMAAGTYGIYVEYSDVVYATANASSPGTVAINLASGKSRYTCAMQAKWDPSNTGTVDTDGDGLTDIQEIEGTYSAGVATNPNDADTDHDGIDDACEEGRKTLGASIVLGSDGKPYTCIADHTSSSSDQPVTGANWQTYWAQRSGYNATPSTWAASTGYTKGNNLGVPLAGGTINTNPNNPDTDGGGTSDAVEIAKGTNPATGNASDDLTVASSPQDMWAASMITDDDSQYYYSELNFTNFGNAKAVVDLVFYNANGSVALKVPAAALLAPHALFKCKPRDYGITSGNVEVRTTSPDVKGLYEVVRRNTNNPNVPDGNGFFKMVNSDNASLNLYAVAYADYAPLKYHNWIYIKNPSDSTANVTVTFYNGSVNTPLSYTVGGHETLTIRPSLVEPYAVGMMTIQGTNGVPVTASMWFERGSVDGNQVDWAAPYIFETSVNTTTYNASFADGIVGFVEWVYLSNPNNASNTINVVFCNAGGTQTYTVQKVLTPYQMIGFRPSTNSVPFGNGSFLVTSASGLPFIASGLVQRALSDPTLTQFDWSFYAPNVTTPKTSLRLSKLRDNGEPKYSSSYVEWVYVSNPSATDTAHLTWDYYNQNGVHTVGTSTGGATIGPKAMIGIRPPVNDAGIAPNEGSLCITSDIPVFGLGLIQQENYLQPTLSGGGAFFDNGAGEDFWY